MKRLIERQKRLLSELARCGYFVRGSINCVCGKCNRASCLCEKKTATKSYRLTYKDNQQKTQIVYIAQNRLPEIKKLLANYSKLRKIVDQFIETNIQIFKKGGIMR